MRRVGLIKHRFTPNVRYSAAPKTFQQLLCAAHIKLTDNAPRRAAPCRTVPRRNAFTGSGVKQPLYVAVTITNNKYTTGCYKSSQSQSNLGRVRHSRTTTEQTCTTGFNGTTKIHPHKKLPIKSPSTITTQSKNLHPSTDLTQQTESEYTQLFCHSTLPDTDRPTDRHRRQTCTKNA